MIHIETTVYYYRHLACAGTCILLLQVTVLDTFLSCTIVKIDSQNHSPACMHTDRRPAADLCLLYCAEQISSEM